MRHCKVRSPPRGYRGLRHMRGRTARTGMTTVMKVASGAHPVHGRSRASVVSADHAHSSRVGVAAELPDALQGFGRPGSVGRDLAESDQGDPTGTHDLECLACGLVVVSPEAQLLGALARRLGVRQLRRVRPIGHPCSVGDPGQTRTPEDPRVGGGNARAESSARKVWPGGCPGGTHLNKKTPPDPSGGVESAAERHVRVAAGQRGRCEEEPGLRWCA